MSIKLPNCSYMALVEAQLEKFRELYHQQQRDKDEIRVKDEIVTALFYFIYAQIELNTHFEDLDHFNERMSIYADVLNLTIEKLEDERSVYCE